MNPKKTSVGDTAICVDNREWEDVLTVDKEYEVLDKNEEKKTITIRDDSGYKAEFMISRFKERFL